ncbi:hypothetical protein RRG08_014388 [Elysia crispata]|uniref:Uncharacterized protein n=1 Tax=Elysia crispata TaxID=231223 RepID=A0AAE1D1R2_9GAST|nr:hypothetical protein RRG08_014388 [Elysia crispata]
MRYVLYQPCVFPVRVFSQVFPDTKTSPLSRQDNAGLLRFSAQRKPAAVTAPTNQSQLSTTYRAAAGQGR